MFSVCIDIYFFGLTVGLLSIVFYGFLIFLFTQGTPCDLITGEERRHASLYTSLTNPEETENNSITEDQSLQIDASELTPSTHVACTVEMTSLNNTCKLLLLFLVTTAYYHLLPYSK